MKQRTLRFTAFAMGIALTLGAVFYVQYSAFAHCQIPCGIYDDPARFTQLRENVTTIEKSMKLIEELSKDPSHHANQIVRWVINKDTHADELAEIVTKYFLQQRIKHPESNEGAEWNDYVKKLTLCHGMLVASMKAKQTTNLDYTAELNTLINDFEKVYFGK